MTRYIIKRLLLLIPILIGVSLIIFTILYFIPGDPGSMILGTSATEEDIFNYNEKIGYNDPFLIRYGRYIFNVVTKFDFGNSYRNGLSIRDQLSNKVPVSVKLSFGSIVFSLLVGIPIGVLSAVKQYSLWDKIPTAIAMFLGSISAFIIGLVLMLIFGLKLGWLPITGITKGFKSYIMPISCLGIVYGAQQMRYTRSSMLETIRQDYVRTAKAKGASRKTIIWKHCMKNALIPVITVAGGNFGTLIGGAIATETLFGLPGLGSYISESIKYKDVPAVMGGLIVFAMIYALIILLVDVSYAFVDPRVKAKFARKG